MNSVQQLKLSQFSKNQKDTARNVARAIASLNNDLAAAIEHQAYARKNPDGVVDQGFLDLMSAGVDQLLSQFAEVAEKRDDLLAVRSGAMTVDELLTKYSTVDLAAYSNALV